MKDINFIYLAIFILLPLSNEAFSQNIAVSSGYSSISEDKNDDQIISISQTKQNTGENAKSVRNYSSPKSRFVQAGVDDSPSFHYKNIKRESYVTTIKLVEFSWLANSKASQPKLASRMIIGFNRPSYGFKNILSVTGNFDFKIDGTVAGISNSLKMTFFYDIRRPLKSNKTHFAMAVNKICFQIGLPFVI